jgi:class 3 adenylate cyclase/predicted ATPase
MDLYAILDQVVELLHQRQRVTYRALKVQFQIEDETLEVLKDELLYAHPEVHDDAGRGLVWTGGMNTPPFPSSPSSQYARQPAPQDSYAPQGMTAPAVPSTTDAERRQLTVLFCDLVASTALASQLDPEDLRDVIRAYQAACAEVIQRFDGHIAQYLGDGLLVYFGYPQAHEDDAHRAVCTGLRMVEAIRTLNSRLEREQATRLAIRIGIHTGLVVVGEVGSGRRQEHLALGETPNIAARLQDCAAPDTVVISTATFRLVQGYFTAEPLGVHTLKGLTAPVPVYRILGESGVQNRLDAVAPTHLTPLVGRDEEVMLLRRRWEQAATGMGQVVLLTGEAGIGKSRLVQVLKDHVTLEPHARIEWRGSPYHQHSALYPVIDHLHRLLRWHPDDLPSTTLRTLETTLATAGVALVETVPLLAALLSLPPPDAYSPLTLTPHRQRQKTLDILLAWLRAEAQRQPVLFIVEDLHWVDPSTLEFLSLLIDQDAQMRLCLVLTTRPEFHPPWVMGAHLTALTLRRFAPAQVERLVTHVAGGKAFPPAVLQEVVRKTDGVPLFVEELTKTVLESGLLHEQADRYALAGPLPPLAIPATLHDALMARLDRLATVKVVAQLGATIGRTFAYDLLQAVAPLEAATLHAALAQLVEAELVAQRGLPPQATYTFKHALIQEAAYQSLLRSTRQQYHQRIAQVVEAQFAETVESQPELLAHHYTEAGLSAQALPYWQRAGQHALQRSAHVEAISHLTKGLEVLQTLPDNPERTQHELTLHLPLGAALMATKGYAAPEVERVYARARALCQQAGETPQRFRVLRGLWAFYVLRGALQTARELAEQCLRLTQSPPEPTLLLPASLTLGGTLFWLGELVPARAHLEQGLTLYDPQKRRARAIVQDPVVNGLYHAAVALWCLGYPDQARARIHEALTLAKELAHAHSQAAALGFAAWLHYFLREGPAAQARAEAAMTFSTEQGFPHWLAVGMILRGWAVAAQGQGAEGITELRLGVAALRATGTELWRPEALAMLAEACGHVGDTEAGLNVLAEALDAVHHTEERLTEAELYRLKGELLCQQVEGRGGVHTIPLDEEADTSAGTPRAALVAGRACLAPTPEAEACFQQALAIARHQEAKALELRAALSLAHLWQRQGKCTEAREVLAPIYGWFTEGFDTADLQEAKVLLNELA